MKNRLLNICILCMVFPFFLQAADTHSVYNLRCEQEENPLGIETGQPCFSWQIQAQQRNFEQSAWHQLHLTQRLIDPLLGNLIKRNR